MARKPEVKVGDQVTCKSAEEAYYSGYAGNPECSFEPGDTGTVAAVEVPYVTRRNSTFVCVDFQKEGVSCGSHGEPWRVGLDYSNIKVLPNEK